MKLVYLDMTPGSSQYTLNMLLTGTSTSRSWKIRISQLPCGATYLSNFQWIILLLFCNIFSDSIFNRFLLNLQFLTGPDGCLQYFTTSVGTFSSFNYKFAATPAVQHLANQDYTICIRMNQVKDEFHVTALKRYLYCKNSQKFYLKKLRILKAHWTSCKTVRNSWP